MTNPILPPDVAAALERWRFDGPHYMTSPSGYTAQQTIAALNAGNELRRLLRRESTAAARLRAFVATVCDEPGDLLYHARDGTFWRREGFEWKAEDARNIVWAANPEAARLRAENEDLIAMLSEREAAR
jgi:hypothetical protein